MKVLLLNGALDNGGPVQGIVDIAEAGFRKSGMQYDTVVLREAEIADCMGCFQCWTKTPGVCIIDDQGLEVAKQFVNANLVILLTPLVFGGYSSMLKKALDRTIPIISPYFITINGETHHKKRYKKYPSLVGIGVAEHGSQEQELVFSQLVIRNSINMHSPFQDSIVFRVNEEQHLAEKKFEELLAKVECIYG